MDVAEYEITHNVVHSHRFESLGGIVIRLGTAEDMHLDDYEVKIQHVIEMAARDLAALALERASRTE